MPGIGNNSDTLLQGLSGFWLRFFKDIGDLQKAYEGAEILFGQAYLDLVSEVLNLSVTGTLLFHREYFRLITIREDELTVRDTGTEMQYVYQAPDAWTAIPSLQNKIFEPSAALEEKIDYTTVMASIRFGTNPLNKNGYKDDLGNTAPAEPLDGFPVRKVDIGISGLFLASTNFYDKGARNGDTLTVSPVYPSEATIAVPPLTILQATPAGLAFAPTAELPTDEEFTYHWKITRTLTDGTDFTVYDSTDEGLAEQVGHFHIQLTLPVQVIALWAVDGKFDQFTLYQNFGHFFAQPKVSSESYRAFIRGLMQLYVLGPAIQRVESGLNVVANLPIILEDIEIFLDYTSGPDVQTVVTDQHTYEFPLGIPMRDDIIAGTVESFRVFDTMTNAIRVTDYLRDPTWWYDITIPVEVLPGRDAQHRHITNHLFPVTIGPIGNWSIGDPRLWLSADENQNLRASDPVYGSICFRHSTPFILMDDYLKQHAFQVTLDPSIEITGILVRDMQSMLEQVKPAHTKIYFSPITRFSDEFLILDGELSLTPKIAIQPDVIAVPDGSLAIGTEWHIGFGYKFNPDRSLTVALITSDPLLCAIVIGGEDPTFVFPPLAPEVEGYTSHVRDLPLYVKASAAP